MNFFLCEDPHLDDRLMVIQVIHLHLHFSHLADALIQSDLQ